MAAAGVAFLLGLWVGRSDDATSPPSPRTKRPAELRLDAEGVTLTPDAALRWDYQGPDSPEALDGEGGGGSTSETEDVDIVPERR